MELQRTDEDKLRLYIATCQDRGHVQQVAFSTFHNALTQVCFTCASVRTSLPAGVF